MIEKPADGDTRKFLINHSEYGPMLAAWIEEGGCFAACGFSGTPGLPFQIVAIREEQVDLVEWIKAVTS